MENSIVANKSAPGQTAIASQVPLSPMQIALRRARRHPGFLIGTGIVLVFVLAAIFAPLIAPANPYAEDIAIQYAPPVWAVGGSWHNILGTDSIGRDVLSRVIYGARISLMIASLSAGIAAVIGTLIGVVGGYFGGRVDNVVMYLITCKLALPGLVVILSLVTIFDSSIPVLVGSIAFLFWDRYAVVSRTVTMQIRSREFITAARAIGSSNFQIIYSEILSNLVNHIIVVLTLEMAIAVLIEAALSFLGLGIQPPTPSWGIMVSEGRGDMFFQPHLVLAPGLAIFILVIAINLMGDGLRDITAADGRR